MCVCLRVVCVSPCGVCVSVWCVRVYECIVCFRVREQVYGVCERACTFMCLFVCVYVCCCLLAVVVVVCVFFSIFLCLLCVCVCVWSLYVTHRRFT